METFLFLAGFCLRFLSERPLNIDPVLTNFIISPPVEADITVRVTWDWEHAALPASDMIGQDAILNYYDEGEVRYCITQGGPKGPLACTSYSPDFRRIICSINEKPFRIPLKSLGSVLRMLPMREIFLHFGALFLHASQVAYRGRGVLFTAPSGTGKTTQAKLWQRYRGAEIICNDRTLIRKADGAWHTYGYPMDGSEPVRSSDVNTLGAVVLLEQGKVNEVRPLRPGKAASLLMGQTVIDGWSTEARTAAMELLLALLSDVPVYRLTCTPDEQAVEVLEEVLMEEGVIPPEE